MGLTDMMIMVSYLLLLCYQKIKLRSIEASNYIVIQPLARVPEIQHGRAIQSNVNKLLPIKGVQNKGGIMITLILKN